MTKQLTLWTAVTFLERRRAILNASRAIRSEPWAVIFRTDSATSGVGMNSPKPLCMFRSG